MAKQTAFKTETIEESNVAVAQIETTANQSYALILQGWVGVAIWMALGLLLEGLLGYRVPAYLEDTQRRELFRLAHTHGTLLSGLLIAAGLTMQQIKTLPPAGILALQFGSLLMPVGFLLAGISHPESDPGVGIWLVPPGGLLMIFGVAVLAFSWQKQNRASGRAS